MLVLQQNNIVFMGTATGQVRALDEKTKGGQEATEKRAHVHWKEREDQGFDSMYSNMQ